jgi:LDH2 family malate/lactate/ureidoglycolate dehydrogenase
MPESGIRIAAPELISFAERILETLDVAAAKARLVATALVAANLRGTDSHGIGLLPAYVNQLEWGNVDARAEGHVVSENGCAMVYDCDNGIGHVTAEICCGHAIRLARAHALALVSARQANHFGAAAFGAQKISAAGQIGMVFCDATPMVPPWQGRQPRVGTNPICMAVPGPWLLDMATTTVAVNRIFAAATNRLPTIPHGWAMDSDGVPTIDTEAARQGMPMPLGGYKGSGLALMVEILCAVLSGGAMANEIGAMRIRGLQSRYNHAFLAIDIERFMPVAEFTARMEHLVKLVKSAAPAAGYDEVLVAGDPEWRAEAERTRNGVPLGGGTWEELIATAKKRGVPAPAVQPF